MNDWFWLLQIGVDFLLLALFLVIVVNLRRARKESEDGHTDDEPVFEFDDDKKKELEILQESLESLVNRVQRVTRDAVEKITEAVGQAEIKEDELKAQIAQVERIKEELPRSAKELRGEEGLPLGTNQERINLRILGLREQGATVDDIAKELKVGRGEVNLVIDLSRAGRNG